jgi:tRNA A37 methylthiotransferase MiaB
VVAVVHQIKPLVLQEDQEEVRVEMLQIQVVQELLIKVMQAAQAVVQELHLLHQVVVALVL